jgi:hypothetical protein
VHRLVKKLIIIKMHGVYVKISKSGSLPLNQSASNHRLSSLLAACLHLFLRPVCDMKLDTCCMHLCTYIHFLIELNSETKMYFIYP